MRRDPLAVRYIDWWARNRDQYPGRFWMDLFDDWMKDQDLTDRQLRDIYADASAEYHEREYHDPTVWGNWILRDEPEGMVVTDFENIPDAEAA